MRATPLRILVIGGGAAGFFGAIRAAECNPQAQVTILERGKETLGKVRISGGGRCNLTHACFEPRELVKHYPRGSRELLGPFHRFACGDTIEWFAQRGVDTKIEDDGRMFPTTDDSATVVECLERSAREAGVQLRLRERVEALHPPDSPDQPWQVVTSAGVYAADRLLVAAGSSPAVWELLGGLGLRIVPPAPSLFTFNTKDTRLADLAGVVAPTAQVAIPTTKFAAAGPLLITHWGLSGPGILRLSAWGARALADCQYRFALRVNWVGLEADVLRQELADLKTTQARRQVGAHPALGLPARLWKSLVDHSGIDAATQWAQLNKAQLQALASQLGEATFQIAGKSTFKDEFVTAGGVDLSEVDFRTFATKRYPTLFLAGEVLDIDAITGGFNFQAAWTGAWIAGEAMASE